MQAFLLFCAVIQYLSYSNGECPETTLSKEIVDIWNELTDLSQELDDEIDIYTYQNFYVLLLDGDELWEGNAIARVQGKYKAICDWDWGKQEADVVCRSLGLGQSQRFDSTQLTREEFPVEFRCDGFERTLGECHMINKTRSTCQNGIRITCDNSGSGRRELRRNCQCDCRMRGAAGNPGHKGFEGLPGAPGSRGQPGEKGEPGGRFRGAPIGPSYYDDEEFVDKIKKRWKGYRGPWGRSGARGEPGHDTKCDCSNHEFVCEELCSPVIGLPGLDGRPGSPGLKGEPGLPGEDALPVDN